MYELVFYVAGISQNSQLEAKHLKEMLDKRLKNGYNLEIVDIINNPVIAEKKKIMATPLLERISPEPVRRIIGDLSDEDKVIIGLDLVSVNVKKLGVKI